MSEKPIKEVTVDAILIERPKLSPWQSINLWRFGNVYVEHRTRPRWSGSLPFYAFKCLEHGIVVNYPQGRKKKLNCPACRAAESSTLSTEASK